MAVTDLTNTKWVFNNNIMATNNGGGWGIDFISNSNSYILITAYYWYDAKHGGENFLSYDNNIVATGNVSSTQSVVNTWTDNAYKTIQITGGTDVTNANLISWLTANATQIVEPNPLVETTISVGTKKLYNAYLGQGALQKIYKGTSLIFNRLEANFETSDNNLLITSNGDVFNVQDAPAPSWFSVTIHNTASEEQAGICSYSLDDGATWIDGSNESSTINLTNVTQIKFKVGWVGTRVGEIQSTQLNLDVNAYQGDQTTQNYILTQNITDVNFYVIYD